MKLGSRFWIATLGVAVILLSLCLLDTCREKNLVIQQLEQRNIELEKRHGVTLEKLSRAIAAADTAKAENASLIANSAQKDHIISQSGDRIHALEQKEQELQAGSAELEANLRGQISEWKSRFSLAIEDRDMWKRVANERLVVISDMRGAVVDAVNQLEAERQFGRDAMSQVRIENKRANRYLSYLKIGGVVSVTALTFAAIF